MVIGEKPEDPRHRRAANTGMDLTATVRRSGVTSHTSRLVTSCYVVCSVVTFISRNRAQCSSVLDNYCSSCPVTPPVTVSLHFDRPTRWISRGVNIKPHGPTEKPQLQISYIRSIKMAAHELVTLALLELLAEVCGGASCLHYFIHVKGRPTERVFEPCCRPVKEITKS